ncbi:hypothetical protein ACJJTC_019080 [Scirpophaga incertulas]
MEGTAALRKTAPDWSLAGDKQLLDVLQNIHESLMKRCQETNQRLQVMATALDDASVDLQNVNNKFMALSNSQFIESRVDDDDADVLTSDPPKDLPKLQEPVSELDMLKASVKILQSMHEEIQIVASDSESDSEEDVPRIVLKPKDFYRHRPLPFIIGSDAWKAKWHAGLVVEDSDSDSMMSKQDEDMDQYSDSEAESPEGPQREDSAQDNQESITSSEMPSYQDYSPVSKPSQAEVAAEIARRLRGSPPRVRDPEPEFTPTVSTKVYRVEQPASTTVFSDEPPPLDQYESDDGSQQEEEDDDIFAELHRSKPNAHASKEQSRMAEELFSGLRQDKTDEEASSNVKINKVQPVPEKQSSIVGQEDSDPELFTTKPLDRDSRHVTPILNTESVKKPIGGISLFGTNKGAESIGAAILRRNQRKSSSDEDSTRESTASNYATEKTTPRNTEKDIINDLFSKPTTKNKPSTERGTNKLRNETPKKIDLFCDDLFDDIDDIFTTSVKPLTGSSKPQKSLFDNDDLFAEVTVSKNNDVIKCDEGKTSLFDSDDDLFSEKLSTNSRERHTNTTNAKNLTNQVTRNNSDNSKQINTQTILKDDDLEHKLFPKSEDASKAVIKEFTTEFVNQSGELQENKSFRNISPEDSKDKNIISKSKDISTITKEININTKSRNKLIANNVSEISKTAKSIFDDDDSDSELFSTLTLKKNTDVKESSKTTTTQGISTNEINVSPKTIFDDDDAKLFLKSNKSKSDYIEHNNNFTEENISQKNIIYNNNTKNGDIENNKLIQSGIAKNAPFLSDADNSSDDIFNRKTVGDSTENSLSNDTSNLSGQINSKPSLFDDDDDLFSKPKKNQPLPIGISPKENFAKNHNGGSKNYLESNSIFETIESTPSQCTNNNSKITGIDEDLNKSSNEDSLFKGSKNNEDQASVFNQSHNDTSIVNDVEISKNLNEEQKIEEKKEMFNITENRKDESLNNIEKSFNQTLDDSLLDALKAAPAMNDVFCEILNEPPAFEKSKEPKKSKNVNALFDDDSDDEALFFKKNDPILDESPQIDTVSCKNALFDIFHDEPPAIDVDFEQKIQTTNNVKISNNDKTTAINKPIFESTEINENLFTNKEKQTYVSENLSKESNLEETHNNVNRVTKTSHPIKSPVTDIIGTKSQDSNESLEQSFVKSHKGESKILHDYEFSDKTDIKKVGKLKNVNINIDINSLLPGASLKKKSVEQTDGQKLSTKSQENLYSKHKIESTIIKSVSFDGEPDSKILDNKISKERVKIQVKRRPSTRRARKEAVRKSAIDIGDDSTDNSSSIDDSIPKPVKRSDNNVIIKNEFKENVHTALEKNIENSDSDKIFTSSCEINSIIGEQSVDNKNKPAIDTQKQKEDPNIRKSKVVYVLNDEDIFNTAQHKRIDAKAHTTSDLFGNKANLYTSIEEKPVISTLGSVYDNTKSATDNKKTEIKTKKSLFDDSSDEDDELFHKPKKILNKHKSILDSDSDEDLFGGKGRKTEKSQKEVKKAEVKETKSVNLKVEVKGSLFGDDDDDDDLFGGKTRTNSGVSTLRRNLSKDAASKEIKPVLEDPLTLLNSDED